MQACIANLAVNKAIQKYAPIVNALQGYNAKFQLFLANQATTDKNKVFSPHGCPTNKLSKKYLKMSSLGRRVLSPSYLFSIILSWRGYRSYGTCFHGKQILHAPDILHVLIHNLFTILPRNMT